MADNSAAVQERDGTREVLPRTTTTPEALKASADHTVVEFRRRADRTASREIQWLTEDSREAHNVVSRARRIRTHECSQQAETPEMFAADPYARDCEGCDFARSKHRGPREAQLNRRRARSVPRICTPRTRPERETPRNAKEEVVKQVAESTHECNLHERVLGSEQQRGWCSVKLRLEK